MSDRQELEELRRLDELERKAAGSEAGNGQASASPAIPVAENTLGQEVKRQGGLFLRAALNAAASPAVLIDKAQAKMSDALTGKHIGGSLGEDLNARLTGLGLPEAERPIERFTQGMAESAPAFALPASLPAQMLGNAAIGAVQAKPGEEGTGGALGAAAGAGGVFLSRALGGIVKPTAEAKTLMDKGVALTPGQAAGAGSLSARLEQSAASLPFAGHAIKGAQRRAVEDANVAAAQSVVNMVDNSVKLGRPPREAIEQTREAVSKHYDDALAGMVVPGFVPQTTLGKVYADVEKNYPMMEKSQVDQMGRFVNGRLNQMILNNGGNLTGEMLKQLDSEIGGFIRSFRSSTNASDKLAAPAWADLQQGVRDVMEMWHPNPEQSVKLKAANAAYRQLLALEKAMLPGNDVFTPRRLRMTLDRMGIDSGDLRNVSNAMNATLPNVVNDSGTAERLLTAGLPALLFGGGAGASNMGYDTLGSGMMAAGLAGSRSGAKFLTGSLPGQMILANALRRTTPTTARTLNNDSDR